MKKFPIYKIIGFLIVIFWIFVLIELVKKTDFTTNTSYYPDNVKLSSAEYDSEEWKEIFLKGQKTGYTFTKIKMIKKGYKIKEQIFLSANIGGSKKDIISVTTAELDEKLLLNNFDFSLSSDLIDIKISGIIKGTNLYLSTGDKGSRSTLIKLQSKPMIGSGMAQFFKSIRLTIGNSYRFPLFDPVTMTTSPALFKVASKEIIMLNNKPCNAFRLEMVFLGNPITIWLDEKGVSLKEEGFMGFTLVRSTQERAKSGLDINGQVDFYELSAIKTTKPLKNSRRSSLLKIQLNHVPSFLPVDDSRQTLKGNILLVIKEVPPFKAAYSLPYSGDNPALSDYLKPEIFIQSNNKEIISMSKKIVRDTSEPFKAAGKILDWVFENLEKVPKISIPDAGEIIKSKKGDCNEHATILTALLRAAGIPSRIVVGLVYKNGKFYYHAWNEVYLNRWISMDATLKQMPVDATHIKLITGGIEKQVRISSIIGVLKITVLDYR